MAIITNPTMPAEMQHGRRKTIVVVKHSTKRIARKPPGHLRNDAPGQVSMQQLTALDGITPWPTANVDRWKRHLANVAAWTANEAPSTLIRPTGGSTPLPITDFNAEVDKERITLRVTPTKAATLWAIAIYRSATPTPTPDYRDCIALIYNPASDPVSKTNRPKHPGTYYFRARTITQDGTFGPLTDAISATTF